MDGDSLFLTIRLGLGHTFDEDVARASVNASNRCTKTGFPSSFTMTLALLSLLGVGVTKVTSVNLDFITDADRDISNTCIVWI
jgi:hypothetical protein